MSLLSNLQLAAYLHRIKNIYSDLTTSQKLAARASILAMLRVIAKLKDEAQISYNYTALPIYSVDDTQYKSYSRRNKLIRSRKCDFYINK